MENTLEKVVAEVDEDLSSEWIALSTRVRNLMASVDAKADGTTLSAEVDVLASETTRLCDHVERLHADVAKLLSRLENGTFDENPHREQSPEIEKEALEIQREIHEGPPNVKDVIKALFMWRDDPVERVRDKH